MSEDLDTDFESIGRDPPFRFLLWGGPDEEERGWRYRLVTLAFVFASLVHLWLPDAWQWSWLGADLVYLAGLGLLARRGAWLGWPLCFVGAMWPLLFAGDQLTQSVILAAWALAGTWGVGWEAWRAVYKEASEPEREPGEEAGLGGFIRAVQVVTVLTYGLAVLHKLNAEFLDPTYSCAVYGLDEVAVYWRLGGFEGPGWLGAAAPWLVLTAEGGIALLLALGVRRAAWTLAVAFHIPLTLVMAPAFAFVMAAGHASFARRADIERLKEVLGDKGSALEIVGFGTAATAASLWLHGGFPPAARWAMVPKEWLLWTTLACLLVAFPPWRTATWANWWSKTGATHPENGATHRQNGATHRQNGATHRQNGATHRQNGATHRLTRAIPATIGLIFLLNGLTPYLGLQYNHTAAMVSNLRIDRGCWNSVVFPESVRLEDPYIRIDEGWLREPGAIPDYEAILKSQLWNPARIRQMRRNWCEPATRPIYLRGTHRGRPFEIEDLCAGEPLPFGQWRLFGEPVFGDFLRFQKNLERACPQRCIH